MTGVEIPPTVLPMMKDRCEKLAIFVLLPVVERQLVLRHVTYVDVVGAVDFVGHTCPRSTQLTIASLDAACSAEISTASIYNLTSQALWYSTIVNMGIGCQYLKDSTFSTNTLR